MDEALREVDEALLFPGREALQKLVSVFREVDSTDRGTRHLFGYVGEALVGMVLALHTVGGQHGFRVAHTAGQARWDIAIRLYEACDNRKFCRSGTARAVKAARQAYEKLKFNLVEVKSVTVKFRGNGSSGYFDLKNRCKAGEAKPLTLRDKYRGSVVIVLLKIIDGSRTTLMAVGIPGDDLPAKSAFTVNLRRDADGNYTATYRGSSKSFEVLALGAGFLDNFLDNFLVNLPDFIGRAYYNDANLVQEPRLVTLQEADFFQHNSGAYLEAVAHHTVVRAGEGIGAGPCFAGWARCAADRRHCDPESDEFKHLERYTAGPYYPILRRDVEFDTWTPDGAKRVQEKVTCATFTAAGTVQVSFNLRDYCGRRYVVRMKDGALRGGWDMLQLQLACRRERRPFISGLFSFSVPWMDWMHLTFAYEARRTSSGALSLSERDIAKAWPEAELLCMWNLSPKDLYDAGYFEEETRPDGTTEYNLNQFIRMVLPPGVAKKLAGKLVVREGAGDARHLTQKEQEVMVAGCTRVRGRGAKQLEKQQLLNDQGLTVVSKF